MYTLSKFYLTVSLFFFCFLLKGQITTSLLQPQFNFGYINPAYRPQDNNFELTLQSQNYGFTQDNPINDRHVHSGSIYKKIQSKNIGLGLLFKEEKNFAFRNTQIGLSGNYAIQSDNFSLSFGLNAGYLHFKKTSDSFGTLRHENDPSFTNSTYSSGGLNLMTGIYFSTDHSKISLSIDHLGVFGKSIDSNTLLERNYLFLATHDFNISDVLTLTPSFFSHIVSKETFIYRPGLTLDLKEVLAFGIQYESLGFFGWSVQLNLYELIPSFSEDITILFHNSQPFQNKTLKSFGSKTEIGLSYGFNFRPNYKKVQREKIIDSPTEYR